MARVVLILPLMALAQGCGGGSSSSPGGYGYGYNYGPVGEFKDDAPPNRQQSAADFPMTFVDHEGKPVDVGQYKGRKNVVLVVLRGIPQDQYGGFCPNCLAQTKSLSASHPEFGKRDAVVLTVFPGPSERVNEFIQKAVEAPKLPFAVLLDKNMSVCERLGIRGDLAKPSTYILDKKGDVVYAYVGETSVDRPSTKALLAQLDKLQAAK